MTAAPVAQVHEGFIRTHQPYVHDRFVDRERELGYVRDQVRAIREERFTPSPLINYWGVKGIGKTWVLEHVRHLYTYQPDEAQARPSFAVLFSVQGQAPNLLPQLVRQLAQAMLSQLNGALRADEQALIAAAQASGTPEDLVAVLDALSLRLVPVILLDNTEQIDPASWQELGRRLIEPLVVGGRVLIVIAGRRQAPRWSRFDVRSKAFPPERTLIKSFSKDAVFNQITRADYSLGREVVEQVFPYTAGNPQLVDAIARHIRAWFESGEASKVDRFWIKRHRAALNSILDSSLTQLLERTPPRLLTYLEAVAPLRFYRLEALRNMLAEYGDGRHADGHYHQILRDLDQQTEVVWWERERRAYVTSDVVRQVMSRRQLLADRELYQRRHNVALQMYRRMVNTFPQASEEFIIEILFHLACLFLDHGDVDLLKQQSLEQLAFADQYLNLERLDILQQQLAGDREIFDLVPAQVHELLSQRLSSLISARV